MGIITAKQLHERTKAVLNQLEQGETMVITRNGRTIGRIEPTSTVGKSDWSEIMADVWRAQTAIKSGALAPNPILKERRR